MSRMLGHTRRTTRTDVGLALSMVGIAYLVWALVAGVTRQLVADLVSYPSVFDTTWPLSTRVVRVVFVEAGSALDVVGLAWLIVSLLLVVYSSRQRVSISWAWLSGVLQTIVAALGGIWVAWAVHLPHRAQRHIDEQATPWAQLSGLSLPVLLGMAILIWVIFLVVLLVDRARLSRHGPSLRDGVRTNVLR